MYKKISVALILLLISLKSYSVQKEIVGAFGVSLGSDAQKYDVFTTEINDDVWKSIARSSVIEKGYYFPEFVNRYINPPKPISYFDEYEVNLSNTSNKVIHIWGEGDCRPFSKYKVIFSDLINALAKKYNHYKVDYRKNDWIYKYDNRVIKLHLTTYVNEEGVRVSGALKLEYKDLELIRISAVEGRAASTSSINSNDL